MWFPYILWECTYLTIFISYSVSNSVIKMEPLINICTIVLQLFIFLLSVNITLILLMCRCAGDFFTDTPWLVILSPMFVGDALNVYFCIIVLIRMYLYSMLRPALLRAIWNISMIGLSFVFKVLLCRKLDNLSSFEYLALFAPLFIILQFILIRACQMKTTQGFRRA